jgi:hypothetical protein
MLRQWIAGPTVRRAVDTLVLQQSVSLEIRQGRLIATWTAPIFGAFPGHFDAEKWSGVLHEMLELARSLESFGDGIRR